MKRKEIKTLAKQLFKNNRKILILAFFIHATLMFIVSFSNLNLYVSKVTLRFDFANFIVINGFLLLQNILLAIIVSPIAVGFISVTIKIVKGEAVTPKSLFEWYKNPRFFKVIKLNMLICIISGVFTGTANWLETSKDLTSNPILIVVMVSMLIISFVIEAIFFLANYYLCIKDFSTLKIIKMSVVNIKGYIFDYYILLISFVLWYVIPLAISAAITIKFFPDKGYTYHILSNLSKNYLLGFGIFIIPYTQLAKAIFALQIIDGKE